MKKMENDREKDKRIGIKKGCDSKYKREISFILSSWFSSSDFDNSRNDNNNKSEVAVVCVKKRN